MSKGNKPSLPLVGGRFMVTKLLPAIQTEDKTDVISEPSTPASTPEFKSGGSHVSLFAAMAKTSGANRKGKGKKSLKGDGDTFSVTAEKIPHMSFRFPDNKPYSIVQTYESLAILTSSSATFVGNGVYFDLSAVNQSSSLTAVFDQYKIKMVEIWIIPRNPLSGTLSASEDRGLLYSVVDYDDANVLGSAGLYENYSNCVVSSAIIGHYRKFVPHAALAAYSGTFTSYTNEANMWIDSGSPAVQFYGVKIGVSQADIAADVVVYDAIIRLNVSFRNVR